MTETTTPLSARLFMAVVGSAYIALAIWCSAAPESTARAIGFELQPGSGQSEYFTVYGGLQFALGWLFLRPVWRPSVTTEAVRECFIIHGTLIFFRMLSLERFTNLSNTTMLLAGLEWVLGLSAFGFFVLLKSQRPHEAKTEAQTPQ